MAAKKSFPRVANIFHFTHSKLIKQPFFGKHLIEKGQILKPDAHGWNHNPWVASTL